LVSHAPMAAEEVRPKPVDPSLCRSPDSLRCQVVGRWIQDKEGLGTGDGEAATASSDPITVDTAATALVVTIPLPDLPEDELDELFAEVDAILIAHPGNSPIVLHLADGEELRLPDEYRVHPHGRLYAQLRALLGADARIEVDLPKPPAITDPLDAAVAA
jgi:hypothetical protein